MAYEGSEVIIDIEDIECCIYKVPRNLRKVNEEAYTPQLISIGPYHYDKEELADMKKHKIRYMLKFHQRITQDKRKELQIFIESHIEKIHLHYAEPCEFSKDKFVEMILCDAVFIMELFLRFLYNDSSDFLLNEVWLRAIRRDLQLLENQLPYFVLEELYKLASASATQNEVSHFQNSFSTLSAVFFQLNCSHNIPLSMQPMDVKIKHFTDLCRYALVEIPQIPKVEAPKVSPDILPNAVKLKKSGVNFERSWGKYLVEINLYKRKRSMPFYNVIELKIPRIEITDNTECLIRNLMALEQCHYPSETYICSYIDLMDSLINTEYDVDLLVESGIIYNPSGDNSVTANMFNKFCQQIPVENTYYNHIYNELRDHYDSRWNHTMATLKSVYFSNPWRSTGTVVAIILLLFTLIQTVFSMLQVFLAK